MRGDSASSRLLRRLRSARAGRSAAPGRPRVADRAHQPPVEGAGADQPRVAVAGTRVRPPRIAVAGVRVGPPRIAVAGALIAVAALLLLSLVGPVAADDDVSAKVAEAGDALEDANAEVRAASAALADAQAKLPAAQAAFAAAQDTVTRAQADDAAAAAALAAATEDLRRTEQERAAKEAEIVALRARVGGFVRQVYQQGPYAQIGMLLDSRTLSDFADRAHAIDSVSRSTNSALDEMAAARADLAMAEAKLSALAAQVQARRDDVARRYAAAQAATTAAGQAKQALDSLVAQREGALAVAESQKAKVARQYQALKDEQARIAAAARRAAAASGGNSGNYVGELLWPIPGAPVVQGVGARVHPVYGYQSCHTGDDIKGTTGTPILAAESGTVAEVTNSGAYGLHTLIAHDGGLSTFYAHQSRTAVSVGQHVSRGQVIGYVGSTGWATGPHLHFEVHVDGTPYDPMGWYGGAKEPVVC